MVKRIRIILIIVLLLIPFTTYAEDHYLYDVLKNEVESGGLAKEYTGQHHDSFLEEPSKKIYHWYAETDDEGNQILDKNNVIFANHCWQMIRTTDTGGVKLIYNGVPNDGKCLSSRSDYNGIIQSSNRVKTDMSGVYAYSDTYSYDLNNKTFHLVDATIDSYDTNKGLIGKYTCKNNDVSANCSTLYYLHNVDEYYPDDSSPYVIPYEIDSTNYSQIGKTSFSGSSFSMANIGYMYGTIYDYKINSYSSNTYFGSSVTWNGSKYTLKDAVKITSNQTNSRINTISNHHYFCLNNTTQCDSVGYIYYWNGTGGINGVMYYILLENGVSSSEEAINKMIKNNINSSLIKKYIDNWYKNEIINYSDFLEDTIFCNNRNFQTTGDNTFEKSGWNSNGGKSNVSIYYQEHENLKLLSCTNINDQFSTNNNFAKLSYPIGLASNPEMILLNNNIIRMTGDPYWLSSPYWTLAIDSVGRYVGNQGQAASGTMINSRLGVRPVISIITGTKYINGTGSQENPYIVRKLNKSNIIFNNDNNGTISNIDNTINVEEFSEITFTITPNQGYELSLLEIKDLNNNTIEYQPTDNSNEYSFIMPDSDVTITTVYEKVKSSINVEIVNETENLNIELNDVTSVEVGEEVDFKVKPIYGYVVNSITITGENGEEVTYTEGDNPNEYTFTMPEYDVTITPRYERKKSKVIPKTNTPAKEFKIEVADAQAVVYEDEVKFTVVPPDSFEVSKIDIIDEDDNYIDYHKTEIKNEYQFKMPGTDVEITPYFEKANLVNPQTGNIKNLIILLVIVSLSTLLVVTKRKKS